MDLHEIGDLAVWSVTSAKPGNGVELLRDGSTETFWQSDGCQPHLVNIQFQRKISVAELQIYLDYKSDESYTPYKLAIRAGSSFHDLKEIKVLDLKEPTGWTNVSLMQSGPQQEPEPLKAFFVQVAVLTNHQNGRDSHLRQIQILGPRRDPANDLGLPLAFTSNAFAGYSTIR